MKSIKFLFLLFPLSSLFPLFPESARRTYVIQIAVRACVPLSKSHSQMDARPLDLPLFSPLPPLPPVKSFSRLCSTNWVATMTVSLHPQCSSVCEYTLEPRDHRDGAHISRLGGCKTAHIHGWRLHCLAEYVPDTLLYCAVGGSRLPFPSPPPTLDNVSRRGAVF